MKRSVIVLTIALALLGITLDAGAVELSLGTATVDQGDSTTLDISISGGDTPYYAGVNAKIHLPDGVTVTSVSGGTVLAATFNINWHDFSDSGGKRRRGTGND